jgi:hypothetical protein
MKIRNTIILIVITIGLFLYMYRYEIIRVRQEEEASDFAKKVMPYESDSVRVLRVGTEEGDVVSLRDNSGWKITEPVKTKVDQNEIDNLLSNLFAASIERELEEPPDNLSQYGLETPNVSVHIEGTEFISDTLYIGEKNPTGTFVYARRSGNTQIFLLPQVIQSQLDKKLFDLRDKLVLDIEREEVEKFIIVGEHGRITCEKRDDEWYILEPVDDMADRGSVSRVLSSVANGKAVGIETEKADDLSKYGLEEPSTTVEVFTGAEGKKHTLYIGDLETRRYYAKDASRSPIFLVNNVFHESINQEVNDLRNKKIMDFDRTKVTSLEIINPEGSVICEMDSASNWFVMKSPGPQREPAKSSKVTQLLSTLVTLRAEEFVDDAPTSFSPYGLENPRLEVAVKGEEGELARVLIGNEKENNSYARCPDRNRVYLVRGSSVSRLIVDFEDLREEEEKDEGGTPED